MSFLQNRPQAKPKVTYVQFAGKNNPKFPNGNYFFIALFGKNVGEKFAVTNDAINTMDLAPLPKTAVSFWCENVPDGQNKYIEWLYTGDNDPANELGMTLPTKQQSEQRIQEIWNGKAFAVKQPQTNWFLPVLTVKKQGKGYDLATIEPMVLIVSESLMTKIVTSAQSPNITDTDNPSMYGRVFSLSKDTTQEDKGKYYDATVLLKVFDETDLPNIETTAAELHEQSFEGINRLYQTVNGGEYNGDIVRAYITALTGMSWEAFVNKYNVFPNAKLEVVETTGW